MAFPLDHVALACTDLKPGTAWLTEMLGVDPGGGGQHPLMGTHNRLWSLGPADYLELIAIDPTAPPPARPRWFGLDRLAGLPASATPQVAGWVVQAPDTTPAPAGSRWETASRAGLEWRITIPDSGLMPPGGIAPALIDWGDAAHPASRLPDTGLRLLRLTLRHPTPLTLPTADPRIVMTTGAPALRATIATPRGEVTL